MIPFLSTHPYLVLEPPPKFKEIFQHSVLTFPSAQIYAKTTVMRPFSFLVVFLKSLLAILNPFQVWVSGQEDAATIRCLVRCMCSKSPFPNFFFHSDHTSDYVWQAFKPLFSFKTSSVSTTCPLSLLDLNFFFAYFLR